MPHGERRPADQDCPVWARRPRHRPSTRHLSRKLAMRARCSLGFGSRPRAVGTPVYRSEGVGGPALPADPGAEPESVEWTVASREPREGRAAWETAPALRVRGGSRVPASQVWGCPSLQSRSTCAEQASRRAPWAHACGVTVMPPTSKPGSCDHDPLSQKLTHMCYDL